MRHRLIAAGLAITITALGACGSGKSSTVAKMEDGKPTSTDDTGTPSVPGTEGGSRSRVNATSSSSADTSNAAASRSDDATASHDAPTAPSRVPVTATTDASCITPGGMQGLTIHTAPHDKVYFSTEYSDHTNENIASRGYQEGFGPGQADHTGLFRVTWRVPVNAPIGTTVIHYIAQYQAYTLNFTIAAVCQ